MYADQAFQLGSPVLQDRVSSATEHLSFNYHFQIFIYPLNFRRTSADLRSLSIRTEEIFRQFRLIAEFGTAAVIVEQDVQRALDISDRGYAFVSGNVAFHDKADDIVTDQRIRNAYLGGYTTSPSSG